MFYAYAGELLVFCNVVVIRLVKFGIAWGNFYDNSYYLNFATILYILYSVFEYFY